MPTTDHDSSARHSGRVTGGFQVVIALLVVLPLLYLFLLGPAVRYHDSCSEPLQRCIETVYLPLDALHSSGLPLAKPLEWYVDLWEK